MPTSECRQRGFSYLLLLFALVAGGITLAAVGQRWQVALQREREAELLFCGIEFRQAIEAYAARAIDGVPAYPERLEELLADPRDGAVRYHLRRLYLDPFTGAADWLLLRNTAGRIVGVHSRARYVAFARHALLVIVARANRPGEPPRVGDWWFVAAGAAPVEADGNTAFETNCDPQPASKAVSSISCHAPSLALTLQRAHDGPTRVGGV